MPGQKHLSIEQRADFNFIRYSNVWEDAGILCEALAPVAKGKRLLSIASGGGNALALLSLDPKEVVAVDLNPAQLACLELQVAAFQSLSHFLLLAFLGVHPSESRLAIYQGLRKKLGSGALSFWDSRPELIEAGILHCGKLERFLRRYKACLRFFAHSAESTEALLAPKLPAEQVKFYNATWNTWRWRLLNRLAFSQAVMGSMGRDPEFFLHAEDDVTSGPSERLEQALKQQPLHNNPYLRYQLCGNYSSPALPLYLQAQHYESIRKRSGRITLFLGQAEKAPGKFSGFNLSNIFEYMSAEQHKATYAALLDKAGPKARLAYWNLHVERSCPDKRATELKVLSKALHEKDQYWVYRSFHVDTNQSLRN